MAKPRATTSPVLLQKFSTCLRTICCARLLRRSYEKTSPEMAVPGCLRFHSRNLLDAQGPVLLHQASGHATTHQGTVRAMKDFDSHFNKIQKQSATVFRVAFVAWIVGALISLALLGGLVYVAIHFLAKVW